jgi:hypothetical protein
MDKSPPANDYSLAIAGASSRTFGTLLDEKAREEEVKKNTATGEKILEKRRREYEEQSLHLDALKNQLIVDGSTLEPDEIKRILVMQLVIGIPAIVSGLGIIIDSVSCQEIRKSKRTGKTGAARLSTGRILCDLAAMVSQLYGEPDKAGNIPDDEKGVLDVIRADTNDRLGYIADQVSALAGMVHIVSKKDDPRIFAGEVPDPKTGTRVPVDDLFDARAMEQFMPEAQPVRVKEEKVFEDEEVLTDDEAEDAKKAVRVDIVDKMKGLKI